MQQPIQNIRCENFKIIFKKNKIPYDELESQDHKARKTNKKKAIKIPALPSLTYWPEIGAYKRMF